MSKSTNRTIAGAVWDARVFRRSVLRRGGRGLRLGQRQLWGEQMRLARSWFVAAVLIMPLAGCEYSGQEDKVTVSPNQGGSEQKPSFEENVDEVARLLGTSADDPGMPSEAESAGELSIDLAPGDFIVKSACAGVQEVRVSVVQGGKPPLTLPYTCDPFCKGSSGTPAGPSQLVPSHPWASPPQLASLSSPTPIRSCQCKKTCQSGQRSSYNPKYLDSSQVPQWVRIPPPQPSCFQQFRAATKCISFVKDRPKFSFLCPRAQGSKFWPLLDCLARVTSSRRPWSCRPWGRTSTWPRERGPLGSQACSTLTAESARARAGPPHVAVDVFGRRRRIAITERLALPTKCADPASGLREARKAWRTSLLASRTRITSSTLHFVHGT